MQVRDEHHTSHQVQGWTTMASLRAGVWAAEQERLAGNHGAGATPRQCRPAAKRTASGVEKMSGSAEVTEERERIASRTRIGAFVFGAQDGLLTTVSVVSAFYGAAESNTTILLAGFATGVAGMVAILLSVIPVYLATRLSGGVAGART